MQPCDNCQIIGIFYRKFVVNPSMLVNLVHLVQHVCINCSRLLTMHSNYVAV